MHLCVKKNKASLCTYLKVCVRFDNTMAAIINSGHAVKPKL